jgi:predicted Zn-dependent protease with MMP-like domain
MDDRHARHRRRDVDRRRRPVDGYRALGLERFGRLVDRAVLTLPDELLDHLDGVRITVEDVPPTQAPPGRDDEVLLAHYEGTGRAGRAAAAGQPPDRLTLFRRPLEARCRTRHDLAEMIREAVVHELAHHLGIDDDRLDELGWG